MRVLVAGLDTAGMLRNLGQGFRELGHEVFTVLMGGKNVYYDNTFDLQCERLAFCDTMGVRNGQPFCEPTPLFHKLVEPFDLCVFTTGTSLLPGLLDLPLLRGMGKRVIMRHTGSDIRHHCPGSLLYNRRGIEYPLLAREVEAVYHTPRASADPAFYLGDIAYDPHFAAKLYTTLMSSLHATSVQTGAALSTLMLRPFHAGVNTYDPEGITPHLPGRVRPLIVHAPTQNVRKGTSVILEALARLEAEGVPFDLVKVQKMPNRELKQLLHDADMVVDQIACGGHGILANEAMASGCVVLGSNDPVTHPLPLRRPVLPIRKDTVYEQLKRVILDLPFRRRVAEASVACMASGLHTNAGMVQYSLDCLERAERKDFDYYPTLLADNPHVPDHRGWIESTGAVFCSDAPRLPFSREPEALPPFLTGMVARCIGRFGLHPHTNLEKLVASGLLGETRGKPFIRRWDVTSLTPVHPWLSLGPNATHGYPENLTIPHAELDPFPVIPLATY